MLQAGILQGDVESLMVMDQWQASLMRALAQLQLKTDAAARSQVEEKFDLEDSSDSEDEADEAEADGSTAEQAGA